MSAVARAKARGYCISAWPTSLLSSGPGKEEFIEIYTQHIHREGSAELLDYLQNKCDFFR